MKLSTETKVYAFFVTAFAGVVILGFLTYRSTRELIVNDRWVAHTHQVRQSIADLEGAVLEAENRRRDYLLTGDSRDLAQFLTNLDRIPSATKTIIELTADNPENCGAQSPDRAKSFHLVCHRGCGSGRATSRRTNSALGPGDRIEKLRG
jgi:CHASE3 domain sensor protein